MPGWKTRKRDDVRFQDIPRISAGGNSDQENSARRKLLAGKSRRPRAFVGGESFTEEEISKIIAFNEGLVKKRGEKFGVDVTQLHSIFSNASRYDNVADARERIIKKAAYLLGGISFLQPFSEGNKETSLYVAVALLRRNGYDLPVSTTAEKLQIYDILVKTVFKFAEDKSIYSELEGFLQKRVRKVI